MALQNSKKIGKPPVSGSQRGVCLFDEVAIAVAAAFVVADNLIGAIYLPAGHKLVSGRAIASDLDTHGTPTVAMSVGVLNAAGDDLVANQDFLTASTVGQAGGVAEFNAAGGLGLAASAVDRTIAIKFDVSAATAAAGTITVQVVTAAVAS